MKKRLLFMVFTIMNFAANAQWHKVTNLYGATVSSRYPQMIAAFGTKVFVATNDTVLNVTNDNGISWGAQHVGSTFTTMYKNGTDLYAGAEWGGVYKSTDNGNTWSPSTNIGSNKVYSLAVSRTTVFAGTEYGVYQTNNNGNSWFQSTFGTFNYPVLSVAAIDSVMFAADMFGVYESRNNGSNWVSASLPYFSGVQSIAVKGSTVFAATTDSLYVSNDTGITWHSITQDTMTQNISHLTVSGSKIYGNNIYHLYQSGDDGSTWSHIGFWPNGIVGFSSNGSSLYVTTYDNEVYSSSDNGLSWTLIGFPVSEVNALTENGNVIYVSSSAGFSSTTDNGASWNTISTSVPWSIVKDENTILATTSDSSIISTDNGSTWHGSWMNFPSGDIIGLKDAVIYDWYGAGILVFPNLGMSSYNNLGNTIGPDVNAFASGTNFLYAATMDGLWASSDGGNYWDAYGLNSYALLCISVIGNDIYAGTLGDGIFYSNNGGINWSHLNNGMPPCDVYKVKTYGNVVVATTSNGVFVSTNSGSLWSQMNIGLPANSEPHHLAMNGTSVFISVYPNISNILPLDQQGLWKRPMSEISDCIANYRTSYNSSTGNFTVTVDPVTSASAIGYLWDFGDGTTSTLPSPTHVYSRDTLYTLCMKIYTGAGDSCEYCHVIGIDSTGSVIRTNGFVLNVVNPNITTGTMQNVTADQIIRVYPNPFVSDITIEGGKFKISCIKVYDVLGNEVQKVSANSQRVILDFNNNGKGIYFVIVEDENGSVLKKKIIKH